MSERSRDRRFPLSLDAVVERKPVERQRETRISSGVSAVSRPTPARTASVERVAATSASAPAPQRVAGVDAAVGAVAASAVQARTQAAHAAAGGMASDRARQALVARVQAAGVSDARVLAAIDLHQFTQAGAALARLMQLGRAQLPGDPEAGVNHDPAHRLLGQRDAMALAQLLAGERGAVIGVMLLD